MSYLDLEVTIGSFRDGVWPIQAQCDGGGEDRAEMTLPFTLGDLETILPDLGLHINYPEDDPRGPKTDMDGWTPRKIGTALFNALFTGNVRNCYERAWTKAGGKLRVILKTDPRDEASRDLCRLPWELMCDNGKWIALARESGLVRYLESSRHINREPLATPLRVLVVLANPKGFEDIDPKRIRTELADLDWGGVVQLTFLEKATLPELGKKLFEPFHVVHFTGHGGFHDGQWSLAFETEDGSVDAVNGDRLAATLCGLEHLHLVTLVSCDGGRVGRGQDKDPFNSIAYNLVLRGVPAVVATQFPLSFAGASQFTNAFYERIAAADPLLAAVDEGRRRIYQVSGSLEWATPVLFSRLKDGHLFNPPALIHINNIKENLDRDAILSDEPNTEIVDFYEMMQSGRSGNWARMYRRIWDLHNKYTRNSTLVFQGEARISFWLAFGYVFSQPSKYHLRVRQLNRVTGFMEEWSGNGKPAYIVPDSQLEQLDSEGEDLVVTLSISRDVIPQTQIYLDKNRQIHVGSWLKLMPEGGPDGGSIKNGNVALGMANAIRKEIDAAGQTFRRIHLFAAMPVGLAMLLGHLLNAHGTIQVYEHQNTGYEPSFLLGENM